MPNQNDAEAHDDEGGYVDGAAASGVGQPPLETSQQYNDMLNSRPHFPGSEPMPGQ